MRRLGASCDWSRERFTLDDGLSAAVRKVFVSLYKKNLIYRDRRLVNWDPVMQTAVSDLEVVQEEVEGAYWHFAYPLEDGSGEIVVATTRPETMLADTAVAVHPDDPRYKGLIGRCVRLPIVGRPIPIIADDYADPEKGSGAVKITPAHDFNDFKVGQRHSCRPSPCSTPPAAWARPRRWPIAGWIARRPAPRWSPSSSGLAYCAASTRSATPSLMGSVPAPSSSRASTDQWFADAKTLADPAIAAVETGRTVFEPEHWRKTFFEWMRNIEPWCISRQLWWGHRIPAWYGPDGTASSSRRTRGQRRRRRWSTMAAPNLFGRTKMSSTPGFPAPYGRSLLWVGPNKL